MTTNLFKDFCCIIALEKADRTIVALQASFRAMQRVSSFEAKLFAVANAFVEPEEVAAAFANPASAAWPADFTIGAQMSAPSLAELWQAAVNNEQQFTLVYRTNEWLLGLLNPGGVDKVCLGDIPDPSVRVSKSRVAARKGIEELTAKVSRHLTCELLERAVAAATNTQFRTAEAHESVKLLCAWWNDGAPPELRSAAAFYVEQWDDRKRHLISGNWETPTAEAEWYIENPRTLALCTDSRLCTPIVIQFLRGAPYEEDHPGGYSLVRAVDGTIISEHGCAPEDMDVAYEGLRGLRSLKFTGLDLRKLPSEAACWRLQAEGKI